MSWGRQVLDIAYAPLVQFISASQPLRSNACKVRPCAQHDPDRSNVLAAVAPEQLLLRLGGFGIPAV